mgnify:CR=1 FL=1
MGAPTLLLTGFEPFLDVKVNASGELAKRLNGVLLDGVEVRSAILPVSFRELPGAYEQALQGTLPLALCSLGVQRAPYYRLESRARPNLASAKPDNTGEFAADQAPLGESPLVSRAQLGALGQSLLTAGAGYVRMSEDAGGYLCERCYWEVLAAAEERGIPGVFLHVPPVEELDVALQLVPVTAMLRELIRQAKA